MMRIASILSPGMIASGLKPNGKKQLLQDVADIAARGTGLESREIFETLLQRERLGSTGIGNGVAIPHGRFPGLSQLHGVFVRLDKPIDFEAVDGVPVDLLFVLMAPEAAGADHLQGLARVARLLRQPALVQKLRATRDPAALHSVIIADDTPRAA